MTPFLEALQAAAKAGFDVPRCDMCNGVASVAVRSCWMCEDYGRDHAYDCEPPLSSKPCDRCHATGLDASDPYGLIGRAMGWLESEMHQVTFIQRIALSRDLPKIIRINYTTLGERKE